MRRLVAWVFLVTLLLPAPPALAQLETDEDDGGCQPGELCGSTDFEDAERAEREVPDPPGDYATSLVTLGCIGLVVGTYLFVALTGRNPYSRLAARRRTG